MRVLIIGCGYVGVPLGAELVRQGHEVYGLRRSSDAAGLLHKAGIQPVQGDITREAADPPWTGHFDWVVNLVSSTRGGLDEYRQVYYGGTKNLLAWLEAAPPRKFVYTSSTGVYGQSDGSQVKESSPTTPEVETAKVLVETEKLLMAAFQERKFPAVILRVAGIYGPDRGYYFKQFLANKAQIVGHGERILNMVHLDDLVGIIGTALRDAHPGEIYNIVDDEPVMELHLYRWLSEALGKWMPPFSKEADEEVRKRGATNKKVLNRKLKMELGYRFKYPTFRQGYTAEIQRLETAGLLNIEPEPR